MEIYIGLMFLLPFTNNKERFSFLSIQHHNMRFLGSKEIWIESDNAVDDVGLVILHLSECLGKWILYTVCQVRTVDTNIVILISFRHLVVFGTSNNCSCFHVYGT